MVSIRPKTIHIGLVWLAALTWSGCTSETKKATAENVDKQAEATPKDTESDFINVSLTQEQYKMANIQLGQPSSRTMNRLLKANGQIDVPASNLVSVTVPFGGYIRKITLEPGQRVRKGQPLVTLENPDYIQFQLDYLDIKAKLAYADLDYARQEELSRENVGALKVFQQTRATRQSLQAQLAAAAQRLAMLRINSATLTPAQLSRTVVIPAPASGYITNVPVNNGRFVNPADILAEITNTEHLHVRLNIFEKDIEQIRVGQVVSFGMGADAALMHRATIFLIGKSLSADRTVPVLAHPDRIKPAFIPGGYVSAQINVRSTLTTTLPETAIIGHNGKQFMYVLKSKTASGNHTFRQLAVQTGTREGGYVAVTLPVDFDPTKTPIVVNGGYSLLSKLMNREEEE